MAIGVSPPPGAGAVQDPHILLAHGGRTDFRGDHKTLWNFLSAQGVSVNMRTEFADFMLGKTLIHGSFFVEMHVVVERDNHTLTLSHWADKMNSLGYSWSGVNGTCDDKRVVMGPHGRIHECGNTTTWVDYATLHVETTEWSITSSPQPVYNRRKGPHHRLDLRLNARVSEFASAPHGIIGQSFVQKRRDGKVDVYPVNAAEFTTSAQAEHAIDGVADDYRMSRPYDTLYRFSQFATYSQTPVAAVGNDAYSMSDTL